MDHSLTCLAARALTGPIEKGLCSSAHRHIVLALALSLVLSWCGPSALATDAPPFEEHNGGFVLELDVPTARTRGKCVEIGIVNFGAIPDGKLWLVARTADDRQMAPPAYEGVTMVDVPPGRVGKARVCLSQVPRLTGGDAGALPSLQVAVFRVTARELAARKWLGPDGGGMRLSVWLALRGELWRNREVAAGNLAPAAAGSLRSTGSARAH